MCNKGFKTDTYLKMHALIHTNERPFSCDQCPAAFNRKDKLKRHMLIHLPQKRFKCPFRSHTGCKKEFSRADKLKAHIITHSGIKPFKCAECGKMFSRKMYLKEHERTHREDPPWKCKSCERGFFRHRQFQLHKCKTVREDKEEPMRTKVKAKLGRPKRRVYSFGVQKTTEEPRGRGRPRKHPQPAKERISVINEEPMQIIMVPLSNNSDAGVPEDLPPVSVVDASPSAGMTSIKDDIHDGIPEVVFSEQQLEQAGIDPYAAPDDNTLTLQAVPLNT